MEPESLSEIGVLRPEMKAVTFDNLKKIADLSTALTDSQKHCVADNMVSVAQGGLSNTGWYRAIFLGNDPIGFIMIDLYPGPGEFPEEDYPALFLWRFMIAREHQGKGYGRQVLDLVTDLFGPQGVRTLYTSCVLQQEDSPYRFYLSCGFTDTGREEHGEQVLRYSLLPRFPDNAVRLPLPVIPVISLVTLWTDRISAMKEFYRNTLGFFVKLDLGNYVEFENRGVRFALCERSVMEGQAPAILPEPAGQRFELAFPCATPEDVDAGYRLLIEHGARAVSPPEHMPWGQKTALFSDPDGNIHEIFAELPEIRQP